MRYIARASLLAFLILLGGIIAPPAHAEWTPPPGNTGPCTRAEVITHRYGHCGWIRMSRLIRFVFGEKYMSRARCVAWTESRYHFYATNGQYRGVYQFGYAWYHGKFNPYSPVASTLRAWSATHGWNWQPWNWECG